MGIISKYKKFRCRFKEGSLITLFFTIGFGFIIGIAISRIMGYPKEINDWISWMVLSASAGAWLKINFQLNPNMDIYLDINWENLPPKRKIWTILEIPKVFYINAIINFINRSANTNSIISESYMVSGDNSEYTPIRKIKFINTPIHYEDINLPDVYQPYTAKRYGMSLLITPQELAGILGDSNKLWVKFIFIPIKGEDIVLTEEINISDIAETIRKSLRR